MAGRPKGSGNKAKEVKEKKEIKKLQCYCCGKETKETDFYMSKSFSYKSIGRLPICKECLGNLYDKYFKKYNDSKLAIYYMCRSMDICFSNSCYVGVVSELENNPNKLAWKVYMTKLNSLGTSVNGDGIDFDSSDKLDIEKEKERVIEENDLPKDISRKWGSSYSKEDIMWLEDTYKEWTNKYKSDTLSEQKTFKLLTIKEYQINKAIENGNNTDKLEETYLKLMSAGNVTPRDSNASMDDENTKGLGVWTKDIEKYRPAEYFEDKKLYKDFDGLFEYLNRFVFRPLKNFLLKTKEYDKEFTIEDEFELKDNK